jgi:hypothetical protein
MKLIQTTTLNKGDFILKNNRILEILIYNEADDEFDGYYKAKFTDSNNEYYHNILMSWCEIHEIRNIKFRLHEKFQKIVCNEK